MVAASRANSPVQCTDMLSMGEPSSERKQRSMSSLWCSVSGKLGVGWTSMERQVGADMAIERPKFILQCKTSHQPFSYVASIFSTGEKTKDMFSGMNVDSDRDVCLFANKCKACTHTDTEYVHMYIMYSE